MSLTEYPELEQGTPEWHEQRRGMVTASTVGLLLTVSAPGSTCYDCPDCAAPADEPCISLRGGTPIKTTHTGRSGVAAANASTAEPVISVADNDTARGLTASLVAERITGHTDPTFINDDMMRGILDEPLARDAYSEHYAPVTQTGFMVRDFGNFKIGFSPDGLVGDDGLIEVKAPRAKGHLQTVLAGAVPVQYMPQLQCGLLVSGRDWIDFLPYYGGLPLWRRRVYPDERWAGAILAAAEKFEQTAAQMIAAYLDATEGLPTTERTLEEIVI